MQFILALVVVAGCIGECLMTSATQREHESLPLHPNKEYQRRPNHHKSDLIGRIFDGRNAVRGQLPYQALLVQRTYRNTSEFCGGALISLSHILTAAHCSYRTEWTEVYLGVVNTDDGTGTQFQIVDKSATFVHPKYNPADFQNDIAVLRLPSRVKLTSQIQLIRLPKLAWAPPSTFDNYIVTASGWGQTYDSENGVHAILQFRRIHMMKQSTCVEKYRNTLPVTEGMICTDKAVVYSGPCRGDSGGPLTVKLTSGLYIIGIVSWGVGNCSSSNPVVYANVAHYLTWISRITGLHLQ